MSGDSRRGAALDAGQVDVAAPEQQLDLAPEAAVATLLGGLEPTGRGGDAELGGLEPGVRVGLVAGGHLERGVELRDRAFHRGEPNIGGGYDEDHVPIRTDGR
jgi:hypothetical protein